MDEEKYVEIIENELNLPNYLRPENVFPNYPVDKEQLQANLYSVYTENYNESKSNVSFLNQLMNIKDGLKKIYDNLENNFNQDYEKVKRLISESPIIEIKRNEFKEELDDYLVTYSYGDYHLDDFDQLTLMISEYIMSQYEIISEKELLEFIISLFTGLFRSVDSITRVTDHILLIDLLIEDIVLSGYQVELPSEITQEQKKRAGIQSKFKPQIKIKYEIYEQFLNEEDTDRVEAHKKLIKWFRDKNLSLEEYKINEDPIDFYNAYWKQKNRDYKNSNT